MSVTDELPGNDGLHVAGFLYDLTTGQRREVEG
jgi:hypothetical protein